MLKHKLFHLFAIWTTITSQEEGESMVEYSLVLVLIVLMAVGAVSNLSSTLLENFWSFPTDI